MIKKVLLTGFFIAAMNSAAFAGAPTNEAECQTLVKDTFTQLAKKSMSDDDAKKAETMLDTLVGQCEKKAYLDAEKTAMQLNG